MEAINGKVWTPNSFRAPAHEGGRQVAPVRLDRPGPAQGANLPVSWTTPSDRYEPPAKKRPGGASGAEAPATLGGLNEKMTAREYASRDAHATSAGDLEARIRTSFSKFERGEDYVVDRDDAKRQYMKFLDTNLQDNKSNLSVKYDPSEPGSMKITENHPGSWRNMYRPHSETRTLDLRGKAGPPDPIGAAAEDATRGLRARGPAGAFEVFQRGGIMEDQGQMSQVVNKFTAKVKNDPRLSQRYTVDRDLSTMTITDAKSGAKNPFLLPAHMPLDAR